MHDSTGNVLLYFCFRILAIRLHIYAKGKTARDIGYSQLWLKEKSA